MRRILPVIGLAVGSILVCTVSAERAPNVQTKEIKYAVGKTSLTGLIAWDANAPGKRPGVLVVHEWWGHDEHARNHSRSLGIPDPQGDRPGWSSSIGKRLAARGARVRRRPCGGGEGLRRPT